MDHLSSIVPKVAQNYRLDSEMNSGHVLEILSQIIQERWGGQGRKNLKPQKIVFNQIYLKAQNSAWAQEFQLQKHDIVEELNQKKLKRILGVKIVV